jgi:hypothetical protein
MSSLLHKEIYCFLFKAGFITFVHCYLERPTQWVLPSLQIELFASFVRLLSWKVTQPISAPNRILNDYFLIFKVRFMHPCNTHMLEGHPAYVNCTQNVLPPFEGEIIASL